MDLISLFKNPALSTFLPILAGRLPQVSNLLESLGPKALDDLVADDIVQVANLFDIEVPASRDLLDQVVSVLRTNDIDLISDALQKPDVLPLVLDKLRSFQSQDEHATDGLTPVKCRHCQRVSYV